MIALANSWRVSFVSCSIGLALSHAASKASFISLVAPGEKMLASKRCGIKMPPRVLTARHPIEQYSLSSSWTFVRRLLHQQPKILAKFFICSQHSARYPQIYAKIFNNVLDLCKTDSCNLGGAGSRSSGNVGGPPNPIGPKARRPEPPGYDTQPCATQLNYGTRGEKFQESSLIQRR